MKAVNQWFMWLFIPPLMSHSHPLSSSFAAITDVRRTLGKSRLSIVAAIRI